VKEEEKIYRFSVDKTTVDNIAKKRLCIYCKETFETIKDLHLHLKKECQNVLINCKFCFKDYERKDFTN